MSSGRQLQPSFVAVLWGMLASILLLAGCASSNLPTPMGGLPAGAPPRPTTTGAYPAVHDLPPPRETTVLTSDEQKKLEDELAAERNRAAGAASAPAN
jgi:hypothetical protein